MWTLNAQIKIRVAVLDISEFSLESDVFICNVSKSLAIKNKNKNL